VDIRHGDLTWEFGYPGFTLDVTSTKLPKSTAKEDPRRTSDRLFLVDSLPTPPFGYESPAYGIMARRWRVGANAPVYAGTFNIRCVSDSVGSLP
jgi:hypothetical protein